MKGVDVVSTTLKVKKEDGEEKHKKIDPAVKIT